MVGRRSVLRTVGTVGVLGVAGCNGSDSTATTSVGDTTDVGTTSGENAMNGEFTVTTNAFEAGEPIPEEFTCSGRDVSPPLSIEGTPSGAESLAIVLDDPDAPSGVFMHWLLWNLPPDTETVPEAVPPQETLTDLGGAKQGTNDFGEIGYRGPCPPESNGPHTYRFKVHALDADLSVEAGATVETVATAIKSQQIATASVVGEFERG